MNLTLHVVRYDLRRMRGWIACWVGVLLLPIGVGAALLTQSPLVDEKWNAPHTLAILAGLEFLVGYLLTIILVHEHGLVGTRHFWLTRPISRARLLGAKTIGALAIVGVIPVLVSASWWVWCGFGPQEMAGAAGEMLAVLSVAIVAGALVAALTDSLARAILWTVVLAAGGLAVTMVFTLAEAAQLNGQHEAALLVSRSVMSLIASVLAMAAIVVVQFLVRCRGGWLAAAGVLLAASFLAGNRWPWPWVPDVPAEENPERAKGVTVGFARMKARPMDPKARPSGEERWQYLETTFKVTGVPGDLSWFFVGVRQRWRWADGRGALRPERMFAGGGPDPLRLQGLRWDWPPHDEETQRFMEEFYKKRNFSRPVIRDEDEVDVAAWLPPSFVARMQVEPPRYEALAYLEVGTTRMEFEAPLATGGWQRTEIGQTKIHRLELTGTTATAVLLRTRPALLRDELRKAASAGAWFYADERERESLLLAINRARREVVAFQRGGAERRAAVVNGVEIEWLDVVAEAPRIVRNGKWTNEPGWMEGATLAGMGFRKEARILRDVRVERLELAK